MVYNTKNVIENLTLEELLKRVTEYDIYRYYLGSRLKIGHIMSSTFRDDKHPSFGIFKSSNGSLLWKDLATGKTGSILTFVKEVEGLYHTKQALKVIYDKIIQNKLHITKEGIIIRDSYINMYRSISIKRQNFSKTDEKYWEQYYISRNTLKLFNVYPIEFFWIDDKLSPLRYTKDCPMYAYKVFNKFKIYRPFSTTREDKWRTNCSSIDILGYEQLPETGDLLIITKSLKDVMVLYELGYTSIALQSENDRLDEKIYKNLSNRFKNIVILFDNDEPGKESAAKLADKFKLNYCFIDSSFFELYKVKDISDYISVFGKEKTIELLKSLLNNEITNC